MPCIPTSTSLLTTLLVLVLGIAAGRLCASTPQSSAPPTGQAAELPPSQRVLELQTSSGITEQRARQHAVLTLLIDLVDERLPRQAAAQAGALRDLRASYEQARAELMAASRGDAPYTAARSAHLRATPERALGLLQPYLGQRVFEHTATLTASARRASDEVRRVQRESDPGGATLAWTLWIFAALVCGLATLRLLSALGRCRLDVDHEPMLLKGPSGSFELRPILGTVVARDQTAEVHHVAGSETRDGEGRLVSSTPGYSYEVVKDTILLRGADGRERPVRLTNWHVASRPGHTMAVIVAFRVGRDSGDYVIVHNEDTRETLRDRTVLAKMLRFPWGPRVALLIGIALFTAASLVESNIQREDGAAQKGILNAGVLVGLGVLLVVSLVGRISTRLRVADFQRRWLPALLARLFQRA